MLDEETFGIQSYAKLPVAPVIITEADPSSQQLASNTFEDILIVDDAELTETVWLSAQPLLLLMSIVYDPLGRFAILKDPVVELAEPDTIPIHVIDIFSELKVRSIDPF